MATCDFLSQISPSINLPNHELGDDPFPIPEPNPNEAGHLIHGSWLCWRIPLKDRDLCLEEPGGCTHQMMASLWVQP